MAEVLLAGLTHYPPLSMPDDQMSGILRRTLDDDTIPESVRDPANWPPAMQREWGTDRATAAAAEHRARLVDGFRRVRAAIDRFEPDVVLVWGDDQHENFREDLIPAFSVLAYDDLVVWPWAQATESAMVAGKANVWGEGPEVERTIRGRPDIGRWLAEALLSADFDVAYAYKPLHHPGLAHAFLNTVLYLDYDRTGWDHPILAMPLNCYGRKVVGAKGFMTRFGDEIPPDPPSPRPGRLMALGGAVASALRDSPWRVAMVASSSWSHAFLCDHTYRLHPDIDADHRLYEAMVAGDIDTWRSTTLDELERAGQQEMLNWFCAVGAAEALGQQVVWSDWIETWCLNSNKVFALWE